MTTTNPSQNTFDFSAQVSLEDNQNATLEVKILSDATTGYTSIFPPGQLDGPEIDNSGSQVIGPGQNLRGDTTISSSFTCIAPQVNEVTVEYLVNDTVVATLKTATRRPIVNLILQFVKP